MVLANADLTAKYRAVLQTALDDSKSAGKTRAISVWYSAYFNNFITAAGYANYMIDNNGQLKHIPEDVQALKLAAICYNGNIVHKPSKDYLARCQIFYESYDETRSEEYIFMAQSFMKMAEDFPVSLGDTLKNPVFWQKIADTALAKKAELSS